MKKWLLAFLLLSGQLHAESAFNLLAAGQALPTSATGSGTTDASKCLKGDGSWGTCGSGSPCDAYPVGSVYIAVVSTNPATALGCGTWSALGAGRTLVGYNASDTDFDSAKETGGAKTVAAAGTNSAPTFAGAALGTHTHDYSTVIAHTHVITELRDATTGGANTNIAVTNDSSSTLGTKVTGSTGSATGTTTAVSAGTPAGTVTAPTFTGSATSVVQPYITVFFFERTSSIFFATNRRFS